MNIYARAVLCQYTAVNYILFFGRKQLRISIVIPFQSILTIETVLNYIREAEGNFKKSRPCIVSLYIGTLNTKTELQVHTQKIEVCIYRYHKTHIV